MNNDTPVLDLSREKLDGQEEPCKGVFYRCSVSTFQAKDGGFGQQVRMRLLKRLSCPGPGKCASYKDPRPANRSRVISCDHDLIQDEVDGVGVSEAVRLPLDPVDGAIYQAQLHVEGYNDPEYGYEVDDAYVEFILVEEN